MVDYSDIFTKYMEDAIVEKEGIVVTFGALWSSFQMWYEETYGDSVKYCKAHKLSEFLLRHYHEGTRDGIRGIKGVTIRGRWVTMMNCSELGY